MNQLMDKLKKVYGYSDYEVKLIQYALTALFYDFSKLIIFGIYYYYTNRFVSYLFALFPLILLRTQNGGIHFKKYWTCFMFTFGYLELCIGIFPSLIPVSQFAMHLILLLCALVNWFVGPNSLTWKTEIPVKFVKRAKTFTLLVIWGLELFLILYPANKYLKVCFWTVVLHTFQLSVTSILKERYSHAKTY